MGFNNNFYLGKKDIHSFPFYKFATPHQDQLEHAAHETGLQHNAHWLLPQLISHIAEWKLPSRNVDGQISPIDFLKLNIESSDEFRVGIYRMLTKLPRSNMIKKQSDVAFVNYSMVVPIFMSAFKKFHNIKYSEWAKEGLDKLVPESLALAMTTEFPDEARDSTILLEQRTYCMTYSSGIKVGQEANPISRWTALKVSGSIFEGMPPLVSTMMLQLWVCHPSLRTEFMVLDPNDWDVMPNPLITLDVLSSTNSPKKTSTNFLDW